MATKRSEWSKEWCELIDEEYEVVARRYWKELDISVSEAYDYAEHDARKAISECDHPEGVFYRLRVGGAAW